MGASHWKGPELTNIVIDTFGVERGEGGGGGGGGGRELAFFHSCVRALN